jgi:hypothetical protein
VVVAILFLQNDCGSVIGCCYNDEIKRRSCCTHA